MEAFRTAQIVNLVMERKHNEEYDGRRALYPDYHHITSLCLESIVDPMLLRQVGPLCRRCLRRGELAMSSSHADADGIFSGKLSAVLVEAGYRAPT